MEGDLIQNTEMDHASNGSGFIDKEMSLAALILKLQLEINSRNILWHVQQISESISFFQHCHPDYM